MSSFIPGDRLWVRKDGSVWWPARALSESEAAAQLGEHARDSSCDLVLALYQGSVTPVTVKQYSSSKHAHLLSYFETSSEKAVTDNEDLRAAIAAATEDRTANSMKVEQEAATLPASSPTAAGLSNGHVSKPHKPAKRARDYGHSSDDDDENGDDVAGRLSAAGRARAGADGEYIMLSATVLRTLAQRISKAVSESDVPSLRIVLCDLDRVDVTLSELDETKIGVAVGSILGNEQCRGLWPLARAVVSFWARHLEPATLEAIKRVKQDSAIRRDGAGAIDLQLPGSPGSPSSPFHLSAFGSPTGVSSSQQQQPPKEQRSNFFRTLCRLLNSPDNTVPVKTETVEQVARDLVKEITLYDERSVLIQRLGNPDLAFVRENLITEKWTAKQYIEQPDEVFVTEKEKAEEQRRLVEIMKAVDASKMAGVNVTALFKCSNCGGKRCSFHEQQTRGADEPTTKFITCLKCKRAWTEE